MYAQEHARKVDYTGGYSASLLHAASVWPAPQATAIATVVADEVAVRNANTLSKPRENRLADTVPQLTKTCVVGF